MAEGIVLTCVVVLAAAWDDDELSPPLPAVLVGVFASVRYP